MKSPTSRATLPISAPGALPFSRHARVLVAASAALVVLNAGAAAAAPLPPEIHDGMTVGQVAKLLGKPEARQSFETKREELWMYDSLKIRFHNGKVAHWEAVPGSPLFQKIEAEKEAEEKAATAPESEDSGMVEAIFNEIMQEVPPEKAGAAPQ